MTASDFIAELLELCEARPLTIRVGRTYQGGFGNAVRVPFIRLAGRWLDEAGFTEGDTLRVSVASGEIRLVRQGGRGQGVDPQRDFFGEF